MAIPTLPDVKLTVDLAGAACTCCSNNEKVVYDDVSGFSSVKTKGGFFFCCGNQEKEENRKTWEAFSSAIEQQTGIPLQQAAQEAVKLNYHKMVEKGKKLKPHQFDQISTHARTVYQQHVQMANAVIGLGAHSRSPSRENSFHLLKIDCRTTDPESSEEESKAI